MRMTEGGKKFKLVQMAAAVGPDNNANEMDRSMTNLQNLQEELDKLNEEESIILWELEHNYKEKRILIYNRRKEIIQTVPDFWVTVLQNHPLLFDFLSKEDLKVFKYFVSLEVEDFNDLESGYSITFNFLPNPYFEGTKLMKTYTCSDDGTTSITSTAIEWKDGMVKSIVYDSAYETKGTKRNFTEYSFFSWFEDEQQKIVPTRETDPVAIAIREEIWPDPLKYFNYDVNDEIFIESDSDDKNIIIEDREITPEETVEEEEVEVSEGREESGVEVSEGREEREVEVSEDEADAEEVDDSE